MVISITETRDGGHNVSSHVLLLEAPPVDPSIHVFISKIST